MGKSKGNIRSLLRRKVLTRIGIILVAGSIILFSVLIRHYNERELFHAIQDRNYEKVEKLIKIGVNVNCHEVLVPIYEFTAYWNQTPLIAACYVGDEKIVKFLMENGADINQIDTLTLDTPLLAALNTRNENRFDIAFMVIKYGADIYYTKETASPLADAMVILSTDTDATKEKGFELFKYLYENQVDTTLPMSQENLLTYATHYSNLRVVRYILENNICGINSYDDRGNTALIVAAQNNEIEIAELLIEKGADKNLTDREGKTALDYALENDNKEMARICGSLSGEPDE